MRNVVVLCLDTVRKDYFDVFAPRLRDGADVSFDQCRAASSWSVPSHASMLTGDLPSAHGVHDYQRSFSVLDRSDTFVEDLPDHRSIAVSANVWAGPAFGFDEPFDDFRAVSPDRRFPGGIDVGEFGYDCDVDGLGRMLAFARASLGHDRPLRSLLNGAAVELEKLFERLPLATPFDDGARLISREALDAAAETTEPFVMFANLMDAHAPHTPVRAYEDVGDVPTTWSSRAFDKWELNVDGEAGFERNRHHVENFRSLYGASIEYLDRVVSAFVSDVRAATDRPTTVVVTSDHGENLGYEADDYLFGHDASLSEGLLHVPLLLFDPPDGYDEAAGRGRYVSHLQLRELVAALGRGERYDPSRERVPAELVGSTNAMPPERESYWTRSIRAVYRDGEKLEWDSRGKGRRSTLDPNRPSWQAVVADHADYEAAERALFDEPIETARERAMAAERTVEPEGATRSRLEDLGYLQG